MNEKVTKNKLKTISRKSNSSKSTFILVDSIKSIIYLIPKFKESG
ncbi:MAG: hypothetical protein N2749_04780 [Clostridia bacterium]|nr:hypothetical protein [Clostridia bacterium]